MKHFERSCVVIKIGSSLLVDENTQRVSEHWLHSLIEDIVYLRHQGCKVVVVSSGSVALGCQHLGFQRHSLSLEKKQAAAAVGQIQLSQNYQRCLQNHNLSAAQILLSLDDSEDRKRFLNARNTMLTLLNMGVIPIVNENDTVATSEIRYGDNDRLAARVAQMVDADTLVLLSDIDGLYTADPRKNKDAAFIERVEDLNPDILAMATDSATKVGSGGMVTKLAAAKIAMTHGVWMLITLGTASHPIQTFLQQKKGTWFQPHDSVLSSKKAWLREHLQPKGTIVVDDGAAQAVLAGKSLLPVGVHAVSGGFRKGDVVRIARKGGGEIARGLCNYADKDVEQMKGLATSALTPVLGYNGIPEVVHCDNMVRI
jgi:glutamate 5-kinase